MRYLKLYEEFNSTPKNKIGRVEFPDIYVDGFITSMEDIGIKCYPERVFVYSDYTRNKINSLWSYSNVLNTKDYKPCCIIIFERDDMSIIKISDVEDDIKHLSENLPNADVFYSTQDDSDEFFVYIVLDVIIPYSKWCIELKSEFKKALVSSGIEMKRFDFSTPAAIFSINKKLNSLEQIEYDKATTDLYKKWNIGEREGRGLSILIDLDLEIADQNLGE